MTTTNTATPWTTSMQKRKAKILAPFGKRLSGPEVRRFKGSIGTMTHMQACTDQSGNSTEITQPTRVINGNVY